jgi:hypothetical protein
MKGTKRRIRIISEDIEIIQQPLQVISREGIQSLKVVLDKIHQPLQVVLEMFHYPS